VAQLERYHTAVVQSQAIDQVLADLASLRFKIHEVKGIRFHDIAWLWGSPCGMFRLTTAEHLLPEEWLRLLRRALLTLTLQHPDKEEGGVFEWQINLKEDSPLTGLCSQLEAITPEAMVRARLIIDILRYGVPRRLNVPRSLADELGITPRLAARLVHAIHPHYTVFPTLRPRFISALEHVVEAYYDHMRKRLQSDPNSVLV
jgi:hypothetical protein